MIGSSEVNKVIRQDLLPVLKQHGFVRLQTRHNWGWHGPCTWVMDIRAVGNYFATVTGWPPMSIGVWLGVFYDFLPREFPGTTKMKLSSEGKPLPREFECQQRSHLDIGLDQRQFTQRLSNPAEQVRTDIWWVEPDGSNIGDVVQDIAQQFLAKGVAWFECMTDIRTAYAAVEQEQDCFFKFHRAACFAKYLERENDYQAYCSRMKHEAHRVGRPEWIT